MAAALFKKLLKSRPTVEIRKRNVRQARPVRPSRANELWYHGKLMVIVKALTKATNASVIPVLERARDAQAVLATDASPDIEAAKAVNSVAKAVGKMDKSAKALAREAARRNLAAVDAGLTSSIKNAVGIDVSGILTGDALLASKIAEANAANVSLIKSIPTEYLDKVREAIEKNKSQGMRFETVIKEIQDIGGVTERRARLIARDQTSKMNSSFNEARQRSLGIDSYRWQGADDERERDSHRAHNGEVFRWDSPPSDTGHPGQDVNCFPAGTLVNLATNIERAYERWYEGRLIEITTSTGRQLRGTPNHPVLTSAGWVALGELKISDVVIEMETQHQTGTPIEQIYEIAKACGEEKEMALKDGDFHGDAGVAAMVVTLDGMSYSGVGDIAHARVTSIASSEYKGFVYNFQTRDGWYVAGGIIAHNCRCTAIAELGV